MTTEPRKLKNRSGDPMDKNKEKGRITYDRCSACGKKFENGEGRYVRLDK